MNSKQRKKDKRAKALIQLGRVAAVEVAAAKGEVEAARAEGEKLADRLAEGMSKARTVEEALAYASARLSNFEAQHKARVAEMVKEGERVLVEQAAKLTEAFDLVLADERRKHAEELKAANAKCAVLKAENDRLRKEVEEPRKLRKRLHAKELENQRLLDDLNKALQKPTEAQPIVILPGALYGGR